MNSSLTSVFHLTDFGDFSYLTHFEFAITSLVTFAELCILLWRIDINLSLEPSRIFTFRVTMTQQFSSHLRMML